MVKKYIIGHLFLSVGALHDKVDTHSSTVHIVSGKTFSLNISKRHTSLKNVLNRWMRKKKKQTRK